VNLKIKDVKETQLRKKKNKLAKASRHKKRLQFGGG